MCVSVATDVPSKLNYLFKYRRLDEKLKFPLIFFQFKIYLKVLPKNDTIKFSVHIFFFSFSKAQKTRETLSDKCAFKKVFLFFSRCEREIILEIAHIRNNKI